MDVEEKELETGATSAVISWMEDHMWLGFLLSFLYPVAVFAGRRWMASRSPYQLRRPLLAWNLLLVVFSVVSFLSLTPTMIGKWMEIGVVGSVCSATHDLRARFWLLLFVLSKVLEYGDTVFIVLRKSPLIFLHWYHHLSACLCSWQNVGRFNDSLILWFAWMNLGVHSLMYTHYALRAVGVRIPKAISQGVTLLQILQHLVALTCIFIASWRQLTGCPCHTTGKLTMTALVAYGSYLGLFVQFYVNRYSVSFDKKK